MKIISSSLLIGILAAGCATGQHKEKSAELYLSANDQLVLTTNASFPASYELRVYIIQAGDSLARIAQKFHVQVSRLKVLNPDIDPRRLKIGMKILVAEEKI